MDEKAKRILEILRELCDDPQCLRAVHTVVGLRVAWRVKADCYGIVLDEPDAPLDEAIAEWINGGMLIEKVVN